MPTIPIIVPYKTSWPDEFQALAAELRRALGPLALRIDHIGSTAVPGLAAKDIIDIQVTVAALDEAVKDALLSLGYAQHEGVSRDHVPPGYSGPESDWEKWYFHLPAGGRRPDDNLESALSKGGRPTHLHVRRLGAPNQRYPLLFRDYLRAHPKTAQAYAELKRRLAANLADPSTYPDVKDPAVDLIYLAAEEWATRMNWKPWMSDG
jgi:GrpB-like predicted nucleotidyltransferase (UPF0157 family)